MTKSLTITANDQSGYIDLYPHATKVFVKYIGGASGTLTPQTCKRIGEEINEVLPNGDTTITASTTFIVDGPGLLTFDVDSISGTIKVDTEAVSG